MTIHQSVIDAIGDTPFIKLRRASDETGCTILGKAEFLNPGQSIKDRAASFVMLKKVVRGRRVVLSSKGPREIPG